MTKQAFNNCAKLAQRSRIGNPSLQQVVSITGKKGIESIVPASQLVESFHWKKLYNYPPQVTNANFFQQDNNTMDFNILQSNRNLTRCFISFTVMSSSQVTLAPIYLWFRYIGWYGNGGDLQINRLWGDYLHWFTGMLLNPDQRAYWSRELLCDPATLLNPITLLAGKTKTVYVPIPLPGSSEKNTFPLFMLNNYLVLRFTSKACVESGTASNVNISNMLIWLESETYPEDEQMHLAELYKANGVHRKVITINQQEQFQTLTTGVQIQPIQLSQFGGLDVASLHVALRLGNVNTGGLLRNVINPGPNAASGIELSSVQFDVDGNIQFPFQLLQDSHALKIPNGQHLKYYPVMHRFWADPGMVFTESATSNIKHLTGQELFKLTPDVVGTNEVQTITLTNVANNAGYYQLSFDIFISLQFYHSSNGYSFQCFTIYEEI